MKSERKVVLFEPWGLGDATIAAAFARESPEQFVLACDSKWADIFLAASSEKSGFRILGITLDYTSRSRSHLFQFGSKSIENPEFGVVNSIRGDFRDWMAARRLFPKAKIRMTGWCAFILRRVPIFDRMIHLRKRPVRNRYRAWAELTGVPFSQIEATYRRIHFEQKRDGIVIHVGAQWRSRQYPKVAELRKKLIEAGYVVKLVAGAKDPLPTGIDESDVTRTGATELVEVFRRAQWAIVNDSGPMHLAAFLGASVLAIARISNIEEWIPPNALAVCSSRMPTGYVPDIAYQSDEIVDGWPDVDEILRSIVQN